MDQYLRAKPCSSRRSGALTQVIVDMIALDLRPINIVNGIGFQRLLRVAEPSYVVHLSNARHIIAAEEMGRRKEAPKGAYC